MLAAAGLALWYALGARGGLAPLVSSLPVARWFRFPIKAVLLPHLVVCLLAGLGVDRLRAGLGWGRFALVAAGTLAVGLGVAAAAWQGAALRWARVDPAMERAVAAAVVRERRPRPSWPRWAWRRRRCRDGRRRPARRSSWPRSLSPTRRASPMG